METIQINEHTWSFEEGTVRFFLLEGMERALLIDSGMTTKNAKDLAEKFTKLPISLLNTHADVDHIGSNSQFEEFYMNPSECPNYFHNGGSGKVIPVWDGDTIDLGGRPLKIIAMPGHTPGSIAVFDIDSWMIFSGDPIQDGKIFMFGDQREMHAYIMSLERLWDMSDEFEKVYPSHGSLNVSKELIPKLIDAAKDILAGKADGKPEKVFGNKEVVLYDFGFAGFLCDK